MKTRLLILVTALAFSSCGFNKKAVQPPADKQAAAKARLTELFQLCKEGKNAEATDYFDKKMFQYDTMTAAERVEKMCNDIKTMHTGRETPVFKEFHLDHPASGGEPEIVTLIVEFHHRINPVRAVYTFAFLDGKYVLAVEPNFGPLNPVSNDTQTKQNEKAQALQPDKSSETAPTDPISAGILNEKAINLPKPAYPAIARSARAAGEVRVAVTVDENGKVIQTAALSGNPLLQRAAVEAARSAIFPPTKVNGRPVKVTGVLKYEFVAP